MRNLTILNSNIININAVFIQPTTYCGLNCKGCYVKAWEKNLNSSENLESWKWLDLFHIFIGEHKTNPRLIGKEVHTNQITLALDNLPSPRGLITEHMQRILVNYLTVAQYGKERAIDTEFHMTVNSIDALYEYRPFSMEQAKCLDLITFSQIHKKDIGKLKGMRDIVSHVNYNFQPSLLNNTKKAIKQKIKILKEDILPNVNTMYLILHKPDTGKDLDQEMTNNYFLFWEQLKETLPPGLLAKVNLDGCVIDAKRYVTTGGGCSSNISRFQVWPNGAVSGCPYSHTPKTKAAIDAVDIIENIQEASKVYEFKKCKIPENLHPSNSRVVRKQLGDFILFD